MARGGSRTRGTMFPAIGFQLKPGGSMDLAATIPADAAPAPTA